MVVCVGSDGRVETATWSAEEFNEILRLHARWLPVPKDELKPDDESLVF